MEPYISVRNLMNFLKIEMQKANKKNIYDDCKIDCRTLLKFINNNTNQINIKL